MASNWIWGNSKRQLVLLDTSAIFMIFEHTIRLEEELTRLLGSYEIKIIQDVYNEIINLQTHGQGKQKHLAKTSLAYITQFEIISHKAEKTVDDSLFQTAKNLSAIIVTNDKKLRKKLLENKISTICLRGKNTLMIC